MITVSFPGFAPTGYFGPGLEIDGTVSAFTAGDIVTINLFTLGDFVSCGQSFFAVRLGGTFGGLLCVSDLTAFAPARIETIIQGGHKFGDACAVQAVWQHSDGTIVEENDSIASQLLDNISGIPSLISATASVGGLVGLNPADPTVQLILNSIRTTYTTA